MHIVRLGIVDMVSWDLWKDMETYTWDKNLKVNRQALLNKKQEIINTLILPLEIQTLLLILKIKIVPYHKCSVSYTLEFVIM